MAVIKIRALERLRDLIACSVKELKGKICVGPASRDKRLRFPSLGIMPERFGYHPQQPSIRNFATGMDRKIAPETGVYDVGRWEGTIVLRIGSKLATQRYELEAKIDQIFLGDITGASPDRFAAHRPGILLIDVPECYDARCAFELETDTWENEKVFANEWYSDLRITAQIPALVPIRPQYDIDSLKLSLTEDLETTVVAGGPLPPDTESYTVNSDGTITPI